jgi:Zn-dependent oligopeptidase
MQINLWDWRYAEQLKKTNDNVDSSNCNTPLQSVLDGMFAIIKASSA